MTNSPCPKCGKRPRQDCGYLRKIPCTSGGGTDFDCVAPDVNGQPCDDCHHVWCDGCKAAAKSWWARFKEWWIKYTDPEPPEPPKPPLTIFPARKPTVLTVGGIAEHYKTTVDGI